MADISIRLPDFKGCRVAVFRSDHASGGTLGYYGTVIGKRGARTYLVEVPALGGVVRVHTRDMLIMQASAKERRVVPLDSFEALCPGEWQFEMSVDVGERHVAERQWEIEFESSPHIDNAVLRGKYRIGSVEKGRFKFAKADLPAPTYVLRMPAKRFGSSRGRLSFKVPARCVLDRAYVMNVLAELLNQELPAEVEPSSA